MFIYDPPDPGHAAAQIVIAAKADASSKVPHVLAICNTVFVRPDWEENSVSVHFDIDAAGYLAIKKIKFEFKKPRVR